MTEPFVGEIVMLGCTFAPQGHAACSGQTISIAQNTALFSIIGTYYGGDGTSTFELPDLRGRSVLHQGQGPGLTARAPGEVGGADTVPLGVTEMAAHSHAAMAASGAGLQGSPTGAVWAGSDDPSYAGPPDAALAAQAIGPAGGGQPHNNRSPYLAINFCIALQGVYPPRQ